MDHEQHAIVRHVLSRKSVDLMFLVLLCSVKTKIRISVQYCAISAASVRFELKSSLSPCLVMPNASLQHCGKKRDFRRDLVSIALPNVHGSNVNDRISCFHSNMVMATKCQATVIMNDQSIAPPFLHTQLIS